MSRPQSAGKLYVPLQSFWPAVVAFAWAAIVGGLCTALTRDAAGVSTIWLVNGFVLGLLLTAGPENRYKILAGAAAGLLISGGLVGAGFWTTFIRLPSHLLEIWLAAKLMNWGPIRAADLARPPAIARFVLLAAVLSCAVGAGLAQVIALASGHTIPLKVLWDSWVAHSLGMLSMTPAAIVVAGPDIWRLLRRDRVKETLLLSALTITLAALVFAQSRYPVLFLVLTPVLIVAFRGGFGGVALAVLATVAVATGFTLAGMGPLTLIPDSTIASRVHLLQIFLAWLMLTMFPVVVVVSEHRRAYRALGRLKDNLRLLADYSSDVIVLTDLSGRRRYVSPSVRETLGWEPADFLTGTFRDSTDPETVSSIALQLEELARDKGRTTIVFRTHRRDGSPIWLESRVQYFRDSGFGALESKGEPVKESGADEGFVVILRDITRRREAEIALWAAHSELESLAWKDALTGLANRRRFDDALATEWARALASGSPIALLMLDVDFFKAYNDRYGHPQGDRCLAAVAQALAANCVRQSDIVCRYGGEEFAVVIPGASVQQAHLIADRIREAVENLGLPHEGSAIGHVTVSVGVAGAIPQRSGDAGTLTEAADKALYECKHRGRNTVVSSETADSGDGSDMLVASMRPVAAA